MWDLSNSLFGARVLLGVVVFAQLAAAQSSGDVTSRDPEFDKVPFAKWFSGAPQTQLKWSDHVLPVILSVHQRLMARVQIQLDGAEAAKRRGEGDLIFYFQLTDAKGRTYQDHTSYDLEKVEEGLKAQDLVCTESAFVMPGDYSVSLAIYDTATKEHSIRKDKLHVAPLKTDLLPDAWRDLPMVEFVEASEPPDHWFLPKVQGKLHLPFAPRRPVRIEVIVNLTPSELGTHGYGIQDRNFSFLFPAVKVISQMSAATPSAPNADAPKAPMNISLLDLSRRHIVFHRENIHELDWESIKTSLLNATSGSIDVKSLADRQHNAAFFVKEVAKESAAGDSSMARAVIVLSGPMVFDAEQDLQGIELKSSPDARIFYIRIHSAPSQRPVLPPDMRRRRGFGGPPGRSTTPGEDTALPLGLHADQLEPMLKGLDPRLFDVMTADQFRRALAAIMSEISSM